MNRTLWVVGGLAFAGCTGGGGSGDSGGSCTLGQGPSEEGPGMRPGDDCIACHSAGEGPDFEVAGTVMPAFDEPVGCLGVEGVTVKITDSTGRVKTLHTNASGNFFTLDPISPPYTVELESGGNTSQMSTPQTETDCMVCHTETGENGAPGRIVAP